MALEPVREVFRKLDQNIWVVTTSGPETKAGLTATLVAPASIVPELPRVLVGLSKQHHTTCTLLESGSFVLNLLSSTQTDLAWNFGLHSGHTAQKWSSRIAYATSPDGDPVLAGTSAWLVCRREQQFDIGDRWLVVAEVLDGQSATDVEPLTIADLLRTATPTQRTTLLRQQELHAQVDSQRILQWRQRTTSSGPTSESPR